MKNLRTVVQLEGTENCSSCHIPLKARYCAKFAAPYLMILSCLNIAIRQPYIKALADVPCQRSSISQV